MNVLKCNAEYGKIYLVDYNGLRECKILGTYGDSISNCSYYRLNIAGFGEVSIPFKPTYGTDPDWYHTSKTRGLLFESVADYRASKPIIEDYGSTNNAYNSRFIEPLFPNMSVCGCGGGMYAWLWVNNKAVKHCVNNIHWEFNENGFNSSASIRIDWFATKEQCEKANINNIEVIRF